MNTRSLIIRGLAVLCLLSSVLCFTGCASIPPVVSVEQLDYSRSDPAGGTTITAKGIKLEDGKLTVDEYSRETHYPSFNQSVKLKGAKFAKAEDLVK